MTERKWNLKIRNETEKAEIWIYGNVIDDADGAIANLLELANGYVFPAKIREQLDEIGEKPVNIYFASDGGDVNAGMAIANIIKRLKGKTTAYIDSWAASIASVIALSCDEIVMPANTFIMIHNPACCVFGNANDLRGVADLLDTIRDSIVMIYKAHDKANTDFQSLMDAETWLTAEKAAEIWDNVTVTDAANKAVACYTRFGGKAPKCLKKPVEPAKPAEPVKTVEPAVDYTDLIRQATEVLEHGN